MAFNKVKLQDAARKYAAKGQFEKAAKELLQIVREEPTDLRVWLEIGDLYAKKGAAREAVDAYLRVAEAYHGQGFFLKAVAVYKQVVELQPSFVGVIETLAELHHKLGLTSDAVRYEEQAARLQGSK